MRDLLVTRGADGTPLYLQFARNLRDHIESGAITPGDALPSERDLSEMAGISRVTVRKAIEALIDEGMLFRRQGSGTFVLRRIETPASVLSSFSSDARLRGEDPGVFWMIKSYAQPTEEEAAALSIPPSTRVARLGRVRLSAGEPLAIEHAVVPADCLPDLTSIGDSLYEAMGRSGFRPVTGTQRVRASLATPTEAGLLGVQQNSEVLRIERVTRVESGRAVEFTRSVYRGDRYDIVTELRGIGAEPD
ncbi:GntR family transcriptional regulator [Polymorphobacter fuscus]|uniref:UTRA domain-containing protein n=1 Tax=Sandarakinorhabdus fusca TaxID=1439888 RepID=A0A7C9KIE9_9SPHN|nr:GntR family transcriptional regulator [Polymorphobacter fuscus]KAB7647935.1 GntR family transcriptional regulator [Polymorphobacter fuscus]MQT17261.1 UTRA domain-containing protein [Polymorphobacter fuscus]NJC08744.1 GntR family transcriptional regulator [Polymorphobacter fuscus]